MKQPAQPAPPAAEGSSDLLRQFKLSDQVYERLFELIVAGDFPVNAKLPAEADLAQRFSVSRPVVREALARLRDDGLVASRQGSGTLVLRRPDRVTLGFKPLASIADMQRVYEFREALEARAAGLAAQRRTDEDLAAIQVAFNRLSAVIESGALGADADLDFHVALLRAAKNQFFLTTLESLARQIGFGIQLARRLSLMRPRERIMLVQAEHEAIYNAVRRGDAAGAEQAMAEHIRNARRRVFEGTGEEPA
jgi:DNA-binding FadR family transcriptional regulator